MFVLNTANAALGAATSIYRKKTEAVKAATETSTTTAAPAAEL